MSTDYQLIIEQQDIIKNTLDRKQEVYTYHMVNLTCNYPVPLKIQCLERKITLFQLIADPSSYAASSKRTRR